MLSRLCVLAGVVVASSIAATPASPRADDLAAVLDRSSAYVTTLEKQLEAIIWHESYRQTDRIPRKFSASGAKFSRSETRTLEAEMLLVWVEANATWLAVRDVISVDGKPVSRRLPELLKNHEIKLRDLRALSDENGRYNIGDIERNFNEPLLALIFLDMRYRPRFKFSDGGGENIDGTPVMRLRFDEVRRPTVIRSVNRDVGSSGIVSVEPSTGRVLRTTLDVSQRSSRLHGRIVVTYGMSEKLGLMVPVEMRESYGFDGGNPDEGITCAARYSDFRRFETGGRLILR
jgi:hypothetical protein